MISKLFNISQVSILLDLIDPITKKPSNHILRYWEKEFKQIKPKKINNRRYYSNTQIELIKIIKFLLKDKGMSIAGVKKQLKANMNKLDDTYTDSLKDNLYKKNLKLKSLKIFEKIKKIKSYGKKNTFKSKNGT